MATRSNTNDTNGAAAERVCATCGNPATHLHHDLPYCEPCARELAAHDRGRAQAGLEALETAFVTLGEVGLDRRHLADAMRQLTDRPDLPAREVVVADWQHGFEHDGRFTPITTKAVA